MHYMVEETSNTKLPVLKFLLLSVQFVYYLLVNVDLQLLPAF